MNYDERIKLIREWISEMIGRYERPAHLAPDQAKLELKDMADDLNRNIPDLNVEQFKSTLERTASNIRSKQRTRTWPTIAVVITAARQSLPTDREGQAPRIESTTADRSERINANRIKRGEPVSDYYVRGSGAAKLIAAGLVTKEEIAAYNPNHGKGMEDLKW